MMILKESLYGWGVCNIPQPRATLDVFADRRNNAAAAPVERRSPGSATGFWSIWVELARRDFPLGQLAGVIGGALAMILFMAWASFYLPVAEPIPQPSVEILARVPEMPVAPQERAPDAPVLPPVSRDRVLAATPPVPQVAPPPKAVVPPRKVALSAPPKVNIIPRKVSREPVLPGPEKVVRSYRDAAVAAGPMPSSQPATRFEMTSRQGPLVASTDVGERYRGDSPAKSSAMPVSRRARLSAGNTTEVDLPQTAMATRNFSMTRSSQTLRGSGSSSSFAPRGHADDISLGSHSGIRGGGRANVAPSSGFEGLPSGASRNASSRIGTMGGGKDVDIPVLAGLGAASGLPGGNAVSSVAPAGDGNASSGLKFDGVGDGHYDPARMISLNQLKACIDPDAEFNLKASLATALDTDGRCAVRNMVFFFKHPENGYTLQVDVYNPDNFVDRCDALRAAIRCVNP